MARLVLIGAKRWESREMTAMKLLRICAVGVILALAPGVASANTVVSTSPKANALLVVAPNSAAIKTAVVLMDQGNSIIVTDSMGNRYDDGSITINGVTAIVGIKPLTTTGVYTLTYTLLAANEDPLTGTSSFTFNAPAVINSSTPTPSTSTSSITVASNSIDTLVYGLLIVSAVIFVLLVWYAIRIFGQFSKKRKR